MPKPKKPPTRRIKHVQQKHDKGCVIASIAMVLDWEYDKVAAEFKNDFNKNGMGAELAKEFICEHRYSVIEKRGTHYADVREHNARMLIPFAPIHIVTVQQFKDNPKHTHAFVMDDKGKIYDPDDPARTEVLFYEVRHIMGFWKD